MLEKRDPTDSIMFITDPNAVLIEVSEILSRMGMATLITGMTSIFRDVQKMFKGEFGAFKPSNTPYHDIDHTLSVFLATARIAHGAQVNGAGLGESEMLRALIASLLHDSGYLQTVDDAEGTGAKYGAKHELRSVANVHEYLATKGLPQAAVNDCEIMVALTKLSIVPSQLKFRTPGIERAARIVATADLIAQVADRLYLEKLLLLYKESVDSGKPMYASEQDLIEKTDHFYHTVVKKRVRDDLGDVAKHLAAHFKNRWDLDRDLYQYNIKKNIDYLKRVIVDGGGNYRDHLKRGGIVEKLTE